MRARISWGVALALLVCGLVLGLSALASAAEPQQTASSWVIVTPLPQDLQGAAAASNGTYAYAAGGYSLGSGMTLDTFYRYNPVNERWDTYPPPMPAAVQSASAVYYPATNSIYVFGGVNLGVFSNATRVFDIAANTWSSAANMPAPRAAMASGYDSATGTIYLVGDDGETVPSSAKTTVWAYNPANNTFSTRAPLPHAVGGAAAGFVNGDLVVAGGRDAAGEIVDLVWSYDPSQN